MVEKINLIIKRLGFYTSACSHLFAYSSLVYLSLCVCVLVTQSCPTLCDPMDCSPPGSSARGILQARILEWAAILVYSSLIYPILFYVCLYVCMCLCVCMHTPYWYHLLWFLLFYLWLLISCPPSFVY